MCSRSVAIWGTLRRYSPYILNIVGLEDNDLRESFLCCACVYQVPAHQCPETAKNLLLCLQSSWLRVNHSTHSSVDAAKSNPDIPDFAWVIGPTMIAHQRHCSNSRKPFDHTCISLLLYYRPTETICNRLEGIFRFWPTCIKFPQDYRCSSFKRYSRNVSVNIFKY